MVEFLDVTISYTDIGHGGRGWYHHESEYPDEGSFGPFKTRGSAANQALKMYSDTPNLRLEVWAQPAPAADTEAT